MTTLLMGAAVYRIKLDKTYCDFQRIAQASGMAQDRREQNECVAMIGLQSERFAAGLLGFAQLATLECGPRLLDKHICAVTSGSKFKSWAFVHRYLVSLAGNAPLSNPNRAGRTSG